MTVAKLAAFCTIGLGLMTAQAAASVIHITHTGVVSQGVDNDGLFGTAGADLTGADYKVVYSFDTSLNSHLSDIFPGYYSVDQYGLGPASAAVTIGGQTVTIGETGNFYRLLMEPGYMPPWMAGERSGAWNRDGSYFMLSEVTSRDNFFGSIDMTHPFFYRLTAADTDPSVTSSRFIHLGRTIWFSDATVSSDGGVPEPGSWALMVGGFGLIGGALRGQRKKARNLQRLSLPG